MMNLWMPLSVLYKSILWNTYKKNWKTARWSKTAKITIITFILGTWTTSPYWSFVCTVITVGQPHRISSLFKISDVFWGSAYESGCSHLQQRKPPKIKISYSPQKTNSYSVQMWHTAKKGHRISECLHVFN